MRRTRLEIRRDGVDEANVESRLTAETAESAEKSTLRQAQDERVGKSVVLAMVVSH